MGSLAEGLEGANFLKHAWSGANYLNESGFG